MDGTGGEASNNGKEDSEKCEGFRDGKGKSSNLGIRISMYLISRAGLGREQNFIMS